MTFLIYLNDIMTSPSAKQMSFLDENKETLSDDFYLKMSNLILEQNKSESKDYKKYKITYMNTHFSRGGHNSDLRYSERTDNYEEDEDIDEDNPDGNDYQQDNNIIEKTVYVLNSKVERLEPGCNIEFENIDGLEHIQMYPFTTIKILQKFGEYKNRINLYYNKDVLITICEH